ncbi:MAG: RDD family protein, partial [Planctomycetota bacterium]
PAADAEVFVLPDGVALAGMGPRVAAAALDLVLAATVASMLLGIPISALFGPGLLLEPTRAWTLVPMVMLVGLAGGTMFDTVFGGTPGKLLTGCRVCGPGDPMTPGTAAPDAPASETEDGRIRLRSLGFSRSLVRNAVKWVLPPVALLVLFDRSGRHRGDVLARAAVVEPAIPDTPE